MQDSVPEGLRSGDAESAIWNTFSCVIAYPYGLGKPIVSVMKRCNTMIAQCDDAAQAAHAGATRKFWQMLHNLHHSSCSTPAELEGDIFSAKNTAETDIVHVPFVLFAKGELSLFYADYETTAKRALEVGDKFAKLMPTDAVIMIETFHRPVALHAAALQTKKRK
jgi:hypothetical protein